ncbi:MAG: hypothetical protein KDD53_12095, partial [Bdellovibrionales bacterium]|nr:hypothetical protein [Bdellovibrionales bacterium]
MQSRHLLGCRGLRKMEFIRRTEFSDPLDGLLAFHALAKAIREEFPSEAIFDGEGVAFTIDECEIWLTMGLEVLNYDAETGQSQVQTVRPTVILARGKEGILSRFLSSTGSRWDELPPQMPIVDGVDRDFVSLTASVEGQLEGLTLMTEILKRIDENDLWRILEHELRYVDDHTAP